MTAKYNGYFNANEEYKKGILKINQGHKENYRELLPLFVIGDEEMAKSVQTEMEVVIKKCSRVIQYHSMDIKGKEYCKWIDDSWLLIGKAYFFEHNWAECQPIFEYAAKKYKKSERRIEARLWLIKTLVEQENYDRAENVLRTLKNNESKITEEYLGLYKAISADYHIAQEDYTKAIIDLESAVTFEKDKTRRIRWTFVLAQLYALQGETIRANTAYKEIVKAHPNYEMEFWAQMNRALSYNSEDGSSFDIKKVLLKMLRDDKNKEYRDKLYYALSKIYRQEGSESKQIRALELSTKASIDDNYQKGLSFLTLGKIYFGKPEYKNAQASYDSCVKFLPEDFPNHELISNTQMSLKDLVAQIIIIETEDSLQALGKLPEAELMAYIEEVIEDKIAEEEARREELQGGTEMGGASAQQNGFDDGQNKGKWYFYNPRNIELGKNEFKSIWGSRANEDNWRRSDQSSIALDDFETIDGEETDSTLSQLSNTDQYLKDIPRDPEAISASNERMADAYYALGNIFKENMGDDGRAIGSFRSLVSRFDTSRHRPTSCYILYRMYLDEQQIDSSNFYKNIVLYKYPESDYAKIIEDPSYAQNLDKVKQQVDWYYKKSYYYYSSGYFTACIEKVDECLSKYPGNYLKNKLEYLKALCVGGQKDKAKLINSLQEFSKSHPGTAEGKDADERIKLLNTKFEDIKSDPPPKYVYEKGSKHLVVILVPKEGNDVEDIKLSISKYNKAYHVGKGIKISSVLFGKNMHMLSLKQFATEKEAAQYYTDFHDNQTSLKKINAKNFDFFVMSYNNYALFFKDQRLEFYDDFMKKHYKL
ncbi:MAG: tetratricopeptide repeat protein [Salibacteraceae bacterium]